MVLLSLFGVSQPYSSKGEAQKAAAHCLKRAVHHHMAIKELFNNALQREQYDVCCNIWNDHNRINRDDNSLFRVVITETALDKPFI
jgi:hypothetical protein